MWSFNKKSGPGTGNPSQQPSFGNQPPSQSQSQSPSPSSSWFNASSVNPSHNQDLKRTRSPPALSTYKQVLQNSTTVLGSHSVPQRTKSPPHVYQRNHPDKGLDPLTETKRPSVSPMLSTQLNDSHAWPQPSADLYKPEARATNQSDFPVTKRTRLPFSTLNDPGFRGNNTSVHDDTQSHSVPQRTKFPPHVYQRNHPDEGFVPSSETKRPSVSPPRLSTRLNSHVWRQPYADLDKPEAPASNLSDLPVTKRTRLPFSTLNDPGLRGNNTSALDDTQRELQAKAKRMARFKNELSQPESNETGNRNQKQQQVDQLSMDKKKLKGKDMNEDQDSSSTVIIGYCPDMCPEQERAERERKGDLDQYERLDGDRNQTTESLAVKKYTRTAEREAALIRPMEILQKTIDYLLKLLDQPYDDRFLGLYNFLWDRMRAVRMDLRMQHIFNLGAITMLEQMIRLHIIAMHELCQYTKGEGFSEGFDAHLNIEQMNKTSVELFQLYDDHRKKGINVPTETEFRGYYALLKLDKHPGYKVEPAELSLDLAKMTPGIRQAAEVLFARNVARACRTGNFIAFFRLVRKASYLQACLMHAHFGKLRTQALASLHSGLQNNQGIPLSQVAKWLGMEEENNMEDLLEYHGFCIKEFDEPYMVKEGQFLNGDSEYPLKCSKLVHMKRSTTVVEDVLSSSSLMTSFPPKNSKVVQLSMQEKSPVINKEKAQVFPKPIEKMADFGSVKNPDIRMQPIFTTPVPVVASPSPWGILKNSNSFESPKVVIKSVDKPSLLDRKFRNSLEKHEQSNIYTIPPQVAPEIVVEVLPDVRMDSPVENSTVQPIFLENLETEEPENVFQEMPNENEIEIEMDTSVDEEVAQAKLKLILRLWRRRAFIKKDLREKRQLAANAALSSLSLGPPMWHYKEQLKAPVDFNIDRAMCERYEKQEQLWSTLNVSNIVAPTLGQRYKYPKFICWKLLFCSLDLGSWLQHKLMPANISNNDDDLALSFPNGSIWKKLDYKKPPNDWTCYLSVVKNIQSDNLVEETVLGANAVMFLASEYISWEVQKIRLFNLISLIPFGSRLPLLIISGSDPSTIVENLGLNGVDKSKINCFSVIPLDGYLIKGLEWLASQCPVQPVVSCVKTRELILKNLKFMQFDDSHNTSPEQCISVINKAVDESVKEVNEAAKSNPVCWPCPEISLLNVKILESYLPSVGWSSAAKIGPLIQALRNCKLPNITNNLSWCCNRSFSGIDIENQKIELEQFLDSYLSPIMGLQLAQKETSILIQKCVGLELHGWSYYLVPKWAMIFGRVFNWQLTGLSNGAFSMAYILEQQGSRFASVSFEDESYNMLTSPSLDEMIQVSCCQSGPGPRPNLELTAAVCEPIEDEIVVSRNDQVEEERNYVEKENERSLSRLLEQCNIVQDIIDKKLSIYF